MWYGALDGLIGIKHTQEILGKSYADIALQDINITQAGFLGEKISSRLLNSVRKIHQLILLCMQLKQVLNYIDFLPYNNKLEAYQIYLTPVFHPNGEAIAVQMISHKFKFFEIGSILHSHENNVEQIMIQESTSSIHLSPRQHEILYLIVHGFPQEYIAQMLQIGRGTLARIVSEYICPKFDIHGSNTKLLIQRASKHGFKNYLPQSMWIWGIIVPDPEILQLLE